VALAGNVILIGAYAYEPRRHPFRHDHHWHAPDIDLEEREGIAYVFERQPSGWREVEQLPARLDRDLAHFGYAVALSERHALVGAPALFGCQAYGDFHPGRRSLHHHQRTQPFMDATRCSLRYPRQTPEM
jgi:hypothetical protein